jgi:maltooligosyltrehalose trehalohydrolase
LRGGPGSEVAVRFDEAARWLVVRRGPIAAACNLGARAQRVSVGGSGRVLLASSPGVSAAGDGVELPPDSVAVLHLGGVDGARGPGPEPERGGRPSRSG